MRDSGSNGYLPLIHHRCQWTILEQFYDIHSIAFCSCIKGVDDNISPSSSSSSRSSDSLAFAGRRSGRAKSGQWNWGIDSSNSCLCSINSLILNTLSSIARLWCSHPWNWIKWSTSILQLFAWLMSLVLHSYLFTINNHIDIVVLSTVLCLSDVSSSSSLSTSDSDSSMPFELSESKLPSLDSIRGHASLALSDTSLSTSSSMLSSFSVSWKLSSSSLSSSSSLVKVKSMKIGSLDVSQWSSLFSSLTIGSKS